MSEDYHVLKEIQVRDTETNEVGYAHIIDDSRIGKATHSSRQSINELCPSFTESGSVVTCEPVEGYPLTVTAEEGATITRCGKNLLGGDALADKIANAGGTKDAANGTITFHPRDTGNLSLFNKFKENTQYTIILYGRSNSADSKYTNLCIYYTDGTLDFAIKFTTPQTNEYIIKVSEAGKTISRLATRYMSGETCLYYNRFGVFEGVVTQEAFEPYNGENFAAGEKIPALSGVNTLWADNGVITVSGKVNPAAEIERLKNAILAMGGNI